MKARVHERVRATDAVAKSPRLRKGDCFCRRRRRWRPGLDNRECLLKSVGETPVRSRYHGDHVVLRNFVSERADRNELLKNLPLREYFVDRGETAKGKRALRNALRVGGEREAQRVFELHPRLLVDRLSAGLGWVIPQKRLGSEHVTDFLVGERLSPGFYWLAVELESPKVRMFTKAGNPSRYLIHAIRQVQDWRGWLESNLSYARTPRLENGLGLIDIASQLPGLVVIGRRAETSETTNRLRRQMMAENRIEIRSYDAFLDEPDRMPLYYRFGDRAWG